MGLRVPDARAAVAELRSRGVVFEEYDLPGLKTVDGIADIGGGSAAWFKDTEGNTIRGPAAQFVAIRQVYSHRPLSGSGLVSHRFVIGFTVRKILKSKLGAHLDPSVSAPRSTSEHLERGVSQTLISVRSSRVMSWAIAPGSGTRPESAITPIWICPA